MDGQYEEAIRFDDVAIEAARRNDDHILESIALNKRASSLADLGHLDDAAEALRKSVDHAIKHRLHGLAVASWGSLVMTLIELLQTPLAVEEARSLTTFVSDLGLERMRPSADSWLACALMFAGELDAAVAASNRAAQVDATWGGDSTTPVHMLRYCVLAEAGNTSMIREAQLLASAATAHLGHASWSFEVSRVDATLALRAGDVEQGMKIASSLWIDEPLAMGHMAIILARHSALIDDAEMFELARRHASSLTRDTPFGAMMMDELEAADAARQSGSGAMLYEVAESWKQVGRPIDALRCELAGVHIDLKAGRGKTKVDRLKDLRARAAAAGASWEADHIASLLRSLGTRSRAKSRTTTVGPLTKRELEIARLVASGLRNSEVAGTLFLAEKTVAAHLSNIYGKVEVRSRVQLTAWIRENDPEFEAGLTQAAV
jgi:DNA-binding CsgD family transcriptional regulator/tetratricopeptide (TPR) repeat protein